MRLTKITLCFATLVLGIASAASSYTIDLSSATTAGNKQLKAGTYKLQVEGNQAIFTQGKESVQVPVTVEKAPSTFRYTSIDTLGGTLKEIDLKGTNTKIMFSPAQPGAPVSTE